MDTLKKILRTITNFFSALAGFLPGKKQQKPVRKPKKPRHPKKPADSPAENQSENPA